MMRPRTALGMFMVGGSLFPCAELELISEINVSSESEVACEALRGSPAARLTLVTLSAAKGLNSRSIEALRGHLRPALYLSP